MGERHGKCQGQWRDSLHLKRIVREDFSGKVTLSEGLKGPVE